MSQALLSREPQQDSILAGAGEKTPAPELIPGVLSAISQTILRRTGNV